MPMRYGGNLTPKQSAYNNIRNLVPSNSLWEESRNSRVNKTEIRENRVPNGPIVIHDARLYKARPNHGRKGQHYTRAQLERMFRERTAGGQLVPILHTHNYIMKPIGFLTDWWFGNDGWLHVSFEIFGKDQMKNNWRYEHLVQDFKKGILNMVSISVRQKRLGKDLWDPNDVTLNEISVCRKGDHKNCDITVIEAADSDNQNRYKSGGEILSMQNSMQLEFQAGPSDVNKTFSMDEVVKTAADLGVALTEEELKGIAANPDPLVAASAIVLRRTKEKAMMTDDQRKQLELEAEAGRKLLAEREENYKKEAAPGAKALLEFYEAEFKAGALNETQYAEAKHTVELVCSQSNAANMLALMLAPVNKHKAELAAREEAQKKFETASNQLKAAERRERQTLTHRAASTAAATAAAAPAAEKRTAASETEAPAKRTKVDNKEVQTTPENLAQTLAPKMDGKYAVIEADANGSNVGWIDLHFRHSLYGSLARSIESQTMKDCQEILGEDDFRVKASTTVIPFPGQQGLSQQRVEHRWGRQAY